MDTLPAPARPAAPTPSRPPKGERTAVRILDVAEELFAQGGYAATSLRDIAVQVGIQQPGLYRYYSGKEELYRQVFERALRPLFDLWDGILAQPEPSAMPAQLPADLTDRLIDILALHPNIARLLLRAATGPATRADEIAGQWLGQLVDYGRRLTRKAGYTVDDSRLALQVIAVFNVLFGYFAAAPLLSALAGAEPDDPALLTAQKALARGLVASFALPG